MAGQGVVVQGVKRTFGEIEAVRGIDLTAPAGEVTALVGPNGAGKTTLLLVLATLLVPDAGVIRIAGHDPITEADSRAACRLMESSIQAATYMVFSMAELDRDKSGMGTTISALLILGDYAITAQVGDSRVYLIRGDSLEQIGRAHV